MSFYADAHRARAYRLRAPKILVAITPSARYVATLDDVVHLTRRGRRVASELRFGSRWNIRRISEDYERGWCEVGSMHAGPAYNWRVTASLSLVRWQGPCPEGYPKNPLGALAFDRGPQDTPQAALEGFAKQVDALVAWREQNKPNRKGPTP